MPQRVGHLYVMFHWKMKFLKRITGFSTAFFGFSWTNSERRAVASQLFREGVIDDLKGFYPAPGDWPKGFEAKLRAAVSNIEVRVQKFRHFVPEKDRSAFNSAWDLFKSHGLNLAGINVRHMLCIQRCRPPEAKIQRMFFMRGQKAYFSVVLKHNISLNSDRCMRSFATHTTSGYFNR